MRLKNAKKIISVISLVLVFGVMLSGCAMLGGGDPENPGGGETQLIISIVLLFAVFYFFMIRPEQKKKKKAQELRGSLSIGDEITTIGGMIGKIVNITEETITFETGEDRVRIKVAKWAVSDKGVK